MNDVPIFKGPMHPLVQTRIRSHHRDHGAQARALGVLGVLCGVISPFEPVSMPLRVPRFLALVAVSKVNLDRPLG